MPYRRKIAGIVLLIAALVAASMSVWFWSQPVTVPTAMTVPSASSSPSQEEPLPSVTTPPTPISTTTPSKELKDPRGNPVSLTIKRGAKTIVQTMPFATRVIDPQHPTWFSSRCGAVAYWNKSTWPKPGVESLKKSLITGHVMCGEWYPLQHLQPKYRKDGSEIPGGHKGDLLYIQYSSGDMVIARAQENSHDVPKTDLNKMTSYTENGGKKAREIRLTTCDREGIIRKDGHALNNVVQRFVVIDVIRAN